MLDEREQQAVIRGLRDGRRDAWTALYDGYSGDVWRYVARLIGGQAGDVADVVQETFLAAARSARQFDSSRGSLWGWLTGIAHNQVSHYWRQIGKTAQLKALAEAQAIELRQWAESVDPLAASQMRRETADLVRGVLAELSAEYAALLTGKYLDELSLEVLACRCGGSAEATKSKLARARREFRTKFDALVRASSPVARE